MADLSELAERFGELLVERDGAASPGELGATAEVSPVTRPRQSKALSELANAGLVMRTKTEVRFTPTGWARFTSPDPVGAGEDLDAALSIWPHEHRSFLELLFSTIIARHHLRDTRAEPYLGFMAIGASGSGKSAMADFACRAFGWAPVQHTVYLQRETPKSVLGRRDPSNGFRFVPAPYLGRPFLCFDELDKGDDAMRRAVLPYFQGNTRVEIEGETWITEPTPMLAANVPRRRADRYSMLPDEYRRRSILIDTGDAPHRGLEAVLRRFYETARLPFLSLDQFNPPASLSPAALRTLELIGDVLTEEGRRFFPPVRALEHATLGRAALLGPEANPVLAAYATGFSYLSCASTVPGLVDDGWQLPLEAIRRVIGEDTGIAALEQAMAREAKARAARRTVRAVGERARTRAELEVLRRRGELTAQLKQAIDECDARRVPHHHRAEAGGLRAQLKRLRDLASHVSTEDSIQELEDAAVDPLRRAQALRDRVDDEKHQEQQRASERKARERDAKRSIAAQQRQPSPIQLRRRDLSDQLSEITDSARQLERLWKRRTTKNEEHPLRSLAALRVLGHPILMYEAPRIDPPRTPSAQDVLRRVMQRKPAPRQEPGFWVSPFDARLRFPGSSAACPRLAEWGPSSRRVLAPILAALHAREDQLRMELGRSARRGRPDVQWQPDEAQRIASVTQSPIELRGVFSE